jgi:hypothetical protein
MPMLAKVLFVAGLVLLFVSIAAFAYLPWPWGVMGIPGGMLTVPAEQIAREQEMVGTVTLIGGTAGVLAMLAASGVAVTSILRSLRTGSG